MDYDMLERGYKAQKDFLEGINILINFEEEKEEENKAKDNITESEMKNLKLFMTVQTEAVNTILKLFEANKDNYEKLKKKEQEKRNAEAKKKAEEYRKNHPVKESPHKPTKAEKDKEMEESMGSLFGDWESESKGDKENEENC